MKCSFWVKGNFRVPGYDFLKGNASKILITLIIQLLSWGLVWLGAVTEKDTPCGHPSGYSVSIHINEQVNYIEGRTKDD
jgi:hypothetical protein